MYMLLSLGQVQFQALNIDIIREESMSSNMNIGFSFLIKKKSRTLIPLLISLTLYAPTKRGARHFFRLKSQLRKPSTGS